MRNEVNETSLERGSPLSKLLGAEDIGLFLLVDSYRGYLISHWLAILLFIVGFSTKPNTETEGIGIHGVHEKLRIG